MTHGPSGLLVGDLAENARERVCVCVCVCESVSVICGPHKDCYVGQKMRKDELPRHRAGWIPQLTNTCLKCHHRFNMVSYYILPGKQLIHWDAVNKCFHQLTL